MRIAVFLVGILGLISGCDRQDACVRIGSDGEFGTAHLENIESVYSVAQSAGLPTDKTEAAYILGVAYAESQIKAGQRGMPVEICLRPGAEGATEYRVYSETGEPLIAWRNTSRRVGR